MDLKQLKELKPEAAKEILLGLGDMLDGKKDGQFSGKDLQQRMSDEAVRASLRIQQDPWRAVKAAIGAGVVCFIMGMATYGVLICKSCS